MLQRLPIALAQVNAGNKSETLSDEIRQTIYSLYWPKEITKKVYNHIMNSIKVYSVKTYDPHRVLHNLKDKIDLRRKDKYIALSILVFNMHRKTLKSHIRIINLKYQLKDGMKNLNYLMDDIPYQIFKIFKIFWLYIKKHGEKAVNP